MQKLPVVILDSEFKKWGCPYCGCLSEDGFQKGSQGHVFSLDSVCADAGCHQHFVVVTDASAVRDQDGKRLYPSPHPRQGLEPHQPQPVEETAVITGVHICDETRNSCFVCGFAETFLWIEGFTTPENAQKMVNMFPGVGVRIFPGPDDNMVVVRIYACPKHVTYLVLLKTLMLSRGGITKKMVDQALSL